MTGLYIYIANYIKCCITKLDIVEHKQTLLQEGLNDYRH